MAGDSISEIDNNRSNDHTYEGNGCQSPWGNDGDGGSLVACDTDLVQTYDEETLSIGTYYNFQAATSGTGGGITNDNTNSPDTFCPLGWQLPYDGTGGDYYDKSRSWEYMFGSYNYAKDQSGARGAMSYPISTFLTGWFSLTRGKLYEMNMLGYYQTITNKNGHTNYATRVNSNGRMLQAHDKGATIPVRCVKYLASSHRRHGGRN